MDDFKGTPGPWSLDEYCNVVHGEKDGYGRKQKVRVSGVTLPGRVTEEYAANTQLVAAAPELLEALLELVGSYDDFRTRKRKPESPQANEIIKARAAIAKALGKE